MNRFLKFGHTKHRVSIRIHDDEPSVIEGASYTPQQLEDMTMSGIPVTSSNNTALLETQGHLESSWDIPLERMRGTDISDLWLAQRESRRKMNDAYKTESENQAKVKAVRDAENQRLIELGKQAETQSKTAQK